MLNWSFDFTESMLAIDDRHLKAGVLLGEYADPDLNEGDAVVNGLDLGRNSLSLIRFRYVCHSFEIICLYLLIVQFTCQPLSGRPCCEPGTVIPGSTSSPSSSFNSISFLILLCVSIVFIIFSSLLSIPSSINGGHDNRDTGFIN